MSSIVEGFNYDIFISYRQKDNKHDGWVTEFVNNLKGELESTFKEEISVYFDINPHDGLLETHDVDASLKEKLKCLVFVPIISRTYCDPKSFAWEHEFKAFIEQVTQDQFGLRVKLSNGNVASRVLPIQIHEIASDDKVHIEEALGGILRPIEFIYKEPGVNRPLRSNEDHPDNNLNKTFYRNQINKIANAIDEIIYSLRNVQTEPTKEKTLYKVPLMENIKEERKQAQKKSPKITRRTLISGIIIPAIIIAFVLVYPKIFGTTDNLQGMTMNISVINEDGQQEIRKVFKDEYITKLSLFFFTNETNDSSKNWLQYGIVNAIWEDLNQFNYIRTGGGSNATHLQEQIKFAKTNNYPYFLTGGFRIADGKYEITSRLYQTSNGTVKIERIFRGNDFFNLIDSISLQTKIDLGITENVLNSSPDLPFKEHSTNNFDAFRYYIKGLYIDSLYNNLQRSIELDSTFALASYNRASYNYTFQHSSESALMDISRGMRHRKRLSEYNDISTRILYYQILGEYDKAIALSEMQCELQPRNILLLDRLMDTYHRSFLVNKYQKVAQKMTELVPDVPKNQINVARSYLFTGELNKGLDVLEKLLKDNPENNNALTLMGEIYLHKSDLESAEETYKKAILIQPENEKYWSRMFDHIAYIHNNPIKENDSKLFTGNYQFETGEINIPFFMHNNYLVGKGQNQGSFFNYSVSDTQVIIENGFQTFTFLRNNQHEVVKAIYVNQDLPSFILWKEDSLILDAKNALINDKKTEALNLFQKAYNHYPYHYYLANFIQYLELIQSQEYEKIKPVLETYAGEYGNLRIFIKNDRFYYEDSNVLIFKLLPLSKDQFMLPCIYDRLIQIIKKNNIIKGLKVIYRDGKEKFFPRTS